MIVFYAYAAVLVGILIVVHELGHFLAARIARVTVERFSVGFGPRLLRVRRGETEYALSAIPLGGYVKMAGQELSEPPAGGPWDPRSFHAKRPGVRAGIVAAGPVMNFVWGVLVSFAVLWTAGLPTLGGPVVGVVRPGSPADSAGIEWGDRILSADGEAVEDVGDVYARAAERPGQALALVVVRGTDSPETLAVSLPAAADTAGLPDLGMDSYIPPVIGDVMSESPADRAGLRRGDRIASIGGTPVRDWSNVGEVVRGKAGEEIEIVWERDGRTMRALVTPEPGDAEAGEGQIGVMATLGARRLGFGEAAVSAVRYAVVTVRMLGQFFVDLVRLRISTEMLGGPIRVVQLASESARWGPMYFFGFMSYLSLSLFFINLLPLPVLDGGHLLLIAIERIRGRKLTDRQVLVWQQVGLVFFACVMVLLIVKDVAQLR